MQHSAGLGGYEPLSLELLVVLPLPRRQVFRSVSNCERSSGRKMEQKTPFVQTREGGAREGEGWLRGEEPGWEKEGGM